MDELAQIGGEKALGVIIDDFVEACFADAMIGFMFRRANKARVKEFEFSHASAFLVADVQYEGRDLKEAHARHRIMGGQFDRRLTILRQVLATHGVPSQIAEKWLAHHESLRGEITHQGHGICR